MVNTIDVDLSEPIGYLTYNKAAAAIDKAKLLVWFDSIIQQIDPYSDEAVEFNVQGADEDANRLAGSVLAGLPATIKGNAVLQTRDNTGIDLVNADRFFTASERIRDQIYTLAAMLVFKATNSEIDTKVRSLLDQTKDLSILTKMLEFPTLAAKVGNFFKTLRPGANDKLFPRLIDSIIPALYKDESSDAAQAALVRTGIGRDKTVTTVSDKLLEQAQKVSIMQRDWNHAIAKSTAIARAFANQADIQPLYKDGIDTKLYLALGKSKDQYEILTLSAALALIGSNHAEHVLDILNSRLDTDAEESDRGLTSRKISITDSNALTYINEIKDKLKQKLQEDQETIAREDLTIDGAIERLKDPITRDAAQSELLAMQSNVRQLQGLELVKIQKLIEAVRSHGARPGDFSNTIANTLIGIVQAQPEEDFNTIGNRITRPDAPNPAERMRRRILEGLKSPSPTLATQDIMKKFEGALATPV